MPITKDIRDVHFVTISGHLIDQHGQEYGTKGAGKTYVGKWLQAQIRNWLYHPSDWLHDDTVDASKPSDWQCVVSNLADPLKEACQVIWPACDAKAEDDKKNAMVDLGGGACVSHRVLWQIVGTEGVRMGVGRALEERGVLPPGEAGTLWARALVSGWHHAWRTISAPGDVATVVIVTDVRFPDELRTLMGNGGAAHICVTRRVDRDTSKTLDLHPSETSLPLSMAKSIAGDKCFVYANAQGVRPDYARGPGDVHPLLDHIQQRIAMAYGLDASSGSTRS